MGYFITSHSRLEQTDTLGYWKLLDNELYMDDNGVLSVTPRFFWTDGYTFPSFVMSILGDKNKYDVRPAHAHDLFCRFHQIIRLNCSLTVLKMNGIVREHNDKVICEDIPSQYLKIEEIKKTDADNTFKRMMEACDMKHLLTDTIRLGVFFNLRWVTTGKKSITEYNIFKEDIGLVGGV